MDKASGSRVSAEKQALQKKILVEEGTLTLESTLQRSDYNNFQEGCNRLCNSNANSVLLDLSRCTYVSSMLIGLLVDKVTMMKERRKDVLVRVSPEVGRFLHMAHLYHLLNYEIVEPSSDKKTSYEGLGI